MPGVLRIFPYIWLPFRVEVEKAWGESAVKISRRTSGRAVQVSLGLCLLLCCAPPAGASTERTARATTLTGVEVVTAASRLDSDRGKGAQAWCPPGKQVIGG